ncbi:hypothetical protein B0H66DRAFT_504978, partial [Apodospora peruviana]
MIFIILLASLATAVLATPLVDSNPASLSATTGFILVANLTDTTRDFSPSINHLKLTGVRIGAGLETAVLTNNTGRTFYENGTDGNIGVVSDSGGTYPISMIMDALAPGEADADYVDYVGIDVGTAQPGIGIAAPPADVPALYGPDMGTFVVCFESQPVYGKPQYPVRFAKAQLVNGVAYQKIPAQCAPITLLPQCAQLDDAVPSGALYDHDYARNVRCYGNVASVTW